MPDLTWDERDDAQEVDTEPIIAEPNVGPYSFDHVQGSGLRWRIDGPWVIQAMHKKIETLTVRDRTLAASVTRFLNLAFEQGVLAGIQQERQAQEEER